MPDIFKERWKEICFILSENINADVSENIYEQMVLRAIEKLEWSQFRREIEIQPSLQIGRQGYIRPDIVIYGPDHKALIVIEVKRPTEDMTRDDTVGQLKSYMRQMKADFGLLVGIEFRIYYDGSLNPQSEPLMLEKIKFDRNSFAGRKFVEMFYKDNFLDERYIPYLKETIGQFNKERKIKELKKILYSEEIKEKILNFLKKEYTDFGQEIVESAMENLKVDLRDDYDSIRWTGKEKISDVNEGKSSSDVIQIYKNKSSGKNFIFIEDVGGGKARLINPLGEIKTFEICLFEEPEERRENYIVNHHLIDQIQMKRYHAFVKEEAKRIPSGERKQLNYNRLKKESPSAAEWLRKVPELLDLSHLNTWKSICDYLEIYVGGNSARRALEKWVGKNKPNWPRVPKVT